MSSLVHQSFRWWCLLALLSLLVACGSQPAAAPIAAPTNAPEPLNVIATYSILGDFVTTIGGDLVNVTTLVGPGGDAHTYEPKPSDSAALAEAAILFENGLFFEEWLDDLYSASGSQATRVVVTEKITPLPAPEGGEHDEHAEDEEHTEEAGTATVSGTPEAEEHAEGEFDPHVWHDPTNAMAMVEAVRAALVAADPANTATYDANAKAYTTQLTELNAFVEQEVAKLPAERRKLVTSHDTFGYFAARYGFEIVGTALGAVSTEVADPAAGELAELVGDIQAAGVPAIFAENVSNQDLMETIAREAGVVLAPTLYTDALGEPGSEGATYVEMIRYNVMTIVNALLG